MTIAKRQNKGSQKVRHEVRQYCIDAVNFPDVIKAIPKEIDIISMRIRIGNPFGRSKLNVNTAMRKLGILYRTIPKPECKEVLVKFEGMTRPQMIANLKKICENESLDYDKAKVRSMIVTHAGVTAHFKEIKKEIRPDNTDQRRKLNVLGLDITEKMKDGHIAKLIRAMSLARYSCNMEKIEVYRIMCSKVR